LLQVQEPLLAVKRLFSPDKVAFQQEVDMLKALGNYKHPHLIKLYATYKIKNVYHLIFPFADDNLRSYWDRNKDPRVDPDIVIWTLNQMRGLASGLNAIHNFEQQHTAGKLTVSDDGQRYGRHGDIKPENILWSNEFNGTDINGILRIADFGLGRLHSSKSRSRIDPMAVGGTPTYAPPEQDLHKPVSRAYDIWSLGCLYLEFITWLLKGASGLEEFADARIARPPDWLEIDSFYEILRPPDKFGTAEARVKESVTGWIESLYSHSKCSESIRDVLSLVQKRLLVVEAPARASSLEVDQVLEGIVEQAKIDKEYLVKNPCLETSRPPKRKRSHHHHRSSSEESDPNPVKLKRPRMSQIDPGDIQEEGTLPRAIE
jgi:serine/threonine protein kinase